MVDILIRGGNAETAAVEMRAALRDIFGVDPIPSSRATAEPAGTRGLVELATLVLTLPITGAAAIDLLARAHLADRLRRLIGKAAEQRKTQGARVLIDPGDGKPIPLEHANHETIRAALAAVEQKLKS